MRIKHKKKIIKGLNKSRKQTLKSYKKSRVVIAVEVLPAGNACDACQKWKGKKIPLKKALRKPPLPIRNCHNEAYGYCRCCYIPVMEK